MSIADAVRVLSATLERDVLCGDALRNSGARMHATTVRGSKQRFVDVVTRCFGVVLMELDGGALELVPRPGG